MVQYDMHSWSPHSFEVGDLLVGRTPALEDYFKSFLVLECYKRKDTGAPYYRMMNARTGEISHHHKVEIELAFVRA